MKYPFRRAGSLPLAILLLVSSVSARAGVVELSFLQEDNREPLAGVVVMVDSHRPVAPVSADVSQKNRAFIPNVLVVPRGSAVNFPNNDNTQHHVYSFSSAKTFNIELYAGEPENPVTFDTAGIVELGCNIHDTMQGFIVVADTPYVTRSGAAGIARLEVPSQILDANGGLTVNVWHPRLVDNSQALTLSLSGPFPIHENLELELAPQPVPADGFGGLQERFRNL